MIAEMIDANKKRRRPLLFWAPIVLPRPGPLCLLSGREGILATPLSFSYLIRHTLDLFFSPSDFKVMN